MPRRGKGDAKDRLEKLDISVSIVYGRTWPGAVNKHGHLSIQTSGYQEVDFAKVLPILHDLAETFELEFFGPVTDDDLRHLAGLENILCLRMSNGKVTDVGLHHLSGLKSLRVLEIRELPVTAREGQLAGLNNLCELHVSGTQLNDEALQHLSGLTELTTVDFSRCPVTDRGLAHLAALTKLQYLDLSATQVAGHGLAVLEPLKNLEDLRLNDLPIADREASCLGRFGNLRSLSLYHTHVGDQGANWLAALTGLHLLTLDKTQIGDDAIRHLAACQRLGNVGLGGTRVTGAGLAHLPATIRYLGLTGLPLDATDFDGIAHLEGLSCIFVDEKVVDDTLLTRLRGLRLGPSHSREQGIVAFTKLPTCPLCKDVIAEGDAVFVARPFALDSDFYAYVEMPIHWDCYAQWELRPRFARQYFQANVDAMRHNQFWGIVQCDARVMLTVNPSQYVEEVEVLLAATGSSFRIPLRDWVDWLRGEWFDACRHEVEREILTALAPSWQVELPTAEALIEAAGFDERREVPKRSPMVERISYEFACENLAKRVAQKGLACPNCGKVSNEYVYQRLESVSLEGPRSCLKCTNCEHEFGPDGLP